MAFVWRQGAQQVPRLRSPEFPVELVGVGEPHAAFLTESRTRSHGWSHVQEIRVAHLPRLAVGAYMGRKSWRSPPLFCCGWKLLLNSSSRSHSKAGSKASS